MGRCFSATTFLSAGNITHTPAYGHMIALGLLATVQERNVSARQIADAAAYRQMIARTERFLTFCGGGATIGYRMREDPAQRAGFRIVRESDEGLVISGKVGMHTSPAYAEDVFISGSQTGIEIGAHRATFIVPVGAPGVTTLCRKIAVRDDNPFVSPLSSRYDELDGQMWLDEVFIPVGADLPARHLAGADRALAALASALLLAVEGRVHAGSGAGLHACHGAGAA